VRATLLEGEYAKGQKVPDAQMEQLNIEHGEVCAQWNYTLRPRDTVLSLS
jgi:Rhodopirellula transposase DDE domain